MSETLDYLASPSALDAPHIISNPGPEFGDDKCFFQGFLGLSVRQIGVCGRLGIAAVLLRVGKTIAW
jgi:hypothetical protein